MLKSLAIGYGPASELPHLDVRIIWTSALTFQRLLHFQSDIHADLLSNVRADLLSNVCIDLLSNLISSLHLTSGGHYY